MIDSVVSADWLHDHLDDDNLIIIDARLKAGDNPETDSLMIKNARLLDMKGDHFRNPKGAFPNAFPQTDAFQASARTFGINKNSTIVVYDNVGIYNAPRIWWLFKTMGHDEVFVLNGGLPYWIKQGYETVPKQGGNYPEGNFVAELNSDRVKFYDYIKDNLESREALVADARSASRFNGEEEEPRPGLRRGHIPDSINIPYKMLLDAEGRYKSEDELKEVLEDLIKEKRPIVFSCGSGVTACVLLQAAESVMKNDHKFMVYDGSWTEFGSLE